jgi:ubiquinone/menaquinone biosynthesis C-methylase UbiE
MDNGRERSEMTTQSATADQRFWDRTAPSYAKKPVRDEEAYRLTLERVRSYLTPSQRVLEVGCGTGTTALHLAPHAAQIVASDLSPGMIDIARAKAEAAGIENVSFLTGTLDDLDVDPRSFDVVMAFNVIHLLADIPGALRRLHNLLTPGGLLVSKTPCIGEMNPLVRLAIPVMRAFGKAPFVNFVKMSSLRESISDAGLTIVETGLYPAKSHSLFIVACKDA